MFKIGFITLLLSLYNTSRFFCKRPKTSFRRKPLGWVSVSADTRGFRIGIIESKEVLSCHLRVIFWKRPFPSEGDKFPVCFRSDKKKSAISVWEKNKNKSGFFLPVCVRPCARLLTYSDSIRFAHLWYLRLRNLQPLRPVSSAACFSCDFIAFTYSPYAYIIPHTYSNIDIMHGLLMLLCLVGNFNSTLIRLKPNHLLLCCPTRWSAKRRWFSLTVARSWCFNHSCRNFFLVRANIPSRNRTSGFFFCFFVF